MLNENPLHLLHFQRVQAFKTVDYLLQLPVDGTAMCAAVGLHSSCAEELWTSQTLECLMATRVGPPWEGSEKTQLRTLIGQIK
ncbi:hypothetical protein TNCV_2868291 [Trichonephila clavipes]|nr:hypothetical protein TNCV_2868291 [Trichonephila clavipes]